MDPWPLSEKVLKPQNYSILYPKHIKHFLSEGTAGSSWVRINWTIQNWAGTRPRLSHSGINLKVCHRSAGNQTMTTETPNWKSSINGGFSGETSSINREFSSHVWWKRGNLRNDQIATASGADPDGHGRDLFFWNPAVFISVDRCIYNYTHLYIYILHRYPPVIKHGNWQSPLNMIILSDISSMMDFPVPCLILRR